MRRIVIVYVLACVFLGGGLAAFADTPPIGSTTTDEITTAAAASALDAAHVQRLIDRYRRRTWHWQRIMQRRVTLTLTRPPAVPLERVHVWKLKSIRLEKVAMHPPHLGAWLCIHRYEGAWTEAGPPYYGGLQMDLGFQRTYGRALLASKGTANNWTPLEQIWVAERAFQAGRGFWPWPNTARFCGLL
jgi:hypothetical protein